MDIRVMTRDTTGATDVIDFKHRHIGPSPADMVEMLAAVGARELDALIAQTLPADIRQQRPLDLGPALSEREVLQKVHDVAAKNKVLTSLIGQGYYGTILPPVILRSVLQNPARYTDDTPYQPEISL